MSGTKSIDEINAMSDEDLVNLDLDAMDAEGAAEAPDEEEGEGEQDGDTAAGEGEEGAAAEGDAKPAPAAEGSEGGEGADAGEGEGGSAPDMVPRARLNEVLADRDDLRLMLKTALALGTQGQPAPAAQQEEAQPEVQAYDFKAAQREYTRLISEGDEEAASKKLDEIEDAREAQRAQDIAAAEARALQRVEQVNEQARVQAVAEALHKQFPFLDHTKDSADDVAILSVQAKTRELINAGKTPAQALAEAGETVGKKFARLYAPAPTPTSKAKEAGDARTKEAVTRGLGVRQPSTQKGGIGTREATAPDIRTMTDEQLDKMSKAELDALLGIER